MKKLILIFTSTIILVCSSICLASDGSDLNKEQKISDTFITDITSNEVSYDKFSSNLNTGLKNKLDEKALISLKNDIKNKFGDLQEQKFYSFERREQQDKITYFASFSKEKIVALVFIFDKNSKITDFALIPVQPKNQPDNTNEETK